VIREDYAKLAGKRLHAITGLLVDLSSSSATPLRDACRASARCADRPPINAARSLSDFACDKLLKLKNTTMESI